MSSRTRSLARTVTVGCAVAGAVAVGAGPANALPIQQPAFTSHYFQHDYLVGAPIPVGHYAFDVDAATNGTGVVRFGIGRPCRTSAGICGPYSDNVSVQWINFANGATGTTALRRDATFVTTGRGPVGLSVTRARSVNLPTFGLVNS